MTVRTLALAAVALAAALPSAASASTATLSAQRGASAFPLGPAGGLQRFAFATEGTPEFTVAVTDDTGRPVTGCLQDGVELQIVDAVTGQVLGTDGCTDDAGLFRSSPLTRKTPYTAVAVIPAALTSDGVAVSPVRSNTLGILIRPVITDTSPTGLVRGGSFPLSGQVDAPRANRAGRIALESRVRGKWKRTAIKALPPNGRFRFNVRDGRWRLHFLPKTGAGYVESTLTVSIVRRRVPAT